MLGHDDLIMQMADENFDSLDDHIEFYNRVMSDEILAFVVWNIMQQRKQWQQKQSDKMKRIINRFMHGMGEIMLICGDRGTGKTLFAFTLAHELHKLGREICWFGPPADLPPWIKNTTLDFNLIPENTVVILDEAGMRYFSRMHMSQESIDFMQHLPVIRQTGRDFIIITQNISIIDVGMLHHASSILYTSSFLFQSKKQERIFMNQYLRMFMPKRRGEALFYSNQEILELEFTKPLWWNEKFSKPYAKITDEAEMYRYMLRIFKDEINDTQVQTYMSYRDCRVDLIRIIQLHMLANDMGIDTLLGMENDKLLKIMRSGFSQTPINDLAAKKTSYNTYSFELTPLQQKEWEMKLNMHPDIAITSEICLNRTMLDEFKSCSKRNLIIAIKGKSGSGKSWGSMSIAEIMSMFGRKKPEAENVCDNANDAMQRIQKVVSNFTIILDEAGIKRVGIGSGSLEMEMSGAIQTLRKSNVDFIFCSPEVSGKYYHFILETHGIDNKQKISRFLVYTTDDKLLGYITLRNPSPALIERYEKIVKDKTQQKVVSRTMSARDDLEKYAEKLLKDDEYLACTSQTERFSYIQMKHPQIGRSGASHVMALVNIKARRHVNG